MRKLLILLVVLLVLAGIAAFAVSNFNTYLQSNREWLAEQASTALGRSVAFDEIGVSFRGGLGASVGDLSIGDDPAFSKESFLKVGRAHVVVKILPALSGRYEVDRVVLESPRVNVIRTKAGFNFDSIGKGPGGKPAEDAPAEAGDVAAAGGEALPFLVSLMDISDGRLSFVDRSASPASEMVVEKLDFSASDVGFDSPVSIDLAMAVLGVAEQNIKVSGTVGPIGSPAAAPQMPLDLNVDVGPLVIDRLKGVPMIGKSIPPELSSPDPLVIKVDVSGKADAPVVKVSFDASDARLVYGSVFNKAKGTRLALQADVAQVADRIDVGAFVLRLAEATFNGGGSIGTGGSQPVDFRVKGANVPLAGWESIFAAAAGLDVGGALDLDIHAVGSAAAGLPALNGSIALNGVRAVQPGGGIEISDLTTVIVLKGDRVEMPPTQLKIGGEPVTVGMTVKSLKNPAADIDITAPTLRLAAVGAAGEGTEKDEVLSGLGVKATFQSAESGPQLRAAVRSSGGSVRDVDYSNLSVDVGLAGQRASLRKLSVKAFKGLITGGGTYDMSDADNPAFAFRGRLAGLDMAAIVAYLNIASSLQMTGKLEGDIELDGSGKEIEEIKRRLTGKGGVEVKDGVLKGVNLAEEVLSSITGVPGLSNLIGPKTKAKYPDLFSQSDTIFEALSGQMTIADGQSNLRDLVLSAKDYQLRGRRQGRLRQQGGHRCHVLGVERPHRRPGRQRAGSEVPARRPGAVPDSGSAERFAAGRQNAAGYRFHRQAVVRSTGLAGNRKGLGRAVRKERQETRCRRCDLGG